MSYLKMTGGRGSKYQVFFKLLLIFANYESSNCFQILSLFLMFGKAKLSLSCITPACFLGSFYINQVWLDQGMSNWNYHVGHKSAQNVLGRMYFDLPFWVKSVKSIKKRKTKCWELKVLLLERKRERKKEERERREKKESNKTKKKKQFPTILRNSW